MALPSFLEDEQLRLVFLGGKGGVGKTTCATATALHLARQRPGDRFLLISTDPAHSLIDCLNDFSPPANLDVTELNASQCLAAFKQEHCDKLHQIASRGTFLDTEDISRLLDLSLPGLDEVMAFLEIARHMGRQTYRCTIVDTAPTGHTLRLLSMPDQLLQWLAVMDTLLLKHRYMKKVFTGLQTKDHLDLFLQELALSVQQLRSLMHNPRHTRFVPVMLAEAAAIQETFHLLQALIRAGLSVADVIVNQFHPESSCPHCRRKRNAQLNHLQLLSGMESFHYSLWAVPLFPFEVCGRDGLTGFWQSATRLYPHQLPALAPAITPAVHHQSTLRQPLREVDLMIFSGKGGVGKSTLASATALWLNEIFPEREILLCSIDPAHSLSACLLTPVGAVPTPLLPGLEAVEIDAQTEFDNFKRQYALELEEFFRRFSPRLDPTFDRKVLEKMLDLSPPGLDEVMALISVMDLLDSNDCDTLVLDSAPTGHLLRLLELPELINQWLQALFDIFLKYKHILQMPNFVQRLVKLFKDVKTLRSLLRDPDSCCLFAVSIATEMAYQETRDLLTSCQRLGIFIPALLINMVTPPSECPVCSALTTRESLIRDKFHRRYRFLEQLIVYRREEPYGLRELKILGQKLYGTSADITSRRHRSTMQNHEA